VKITKQHYKELETSINEVLSEYPETDIKEARETVKFVNNQFISFCWLCLHKTVTKNQHLRDLLNNYLDSHIETAIKKILVKYS